MDWKLVGYAISCVSVLLLGAVAWPGNEHASWKLAVLIGGMATSVLGMACREYSHRKERAALAYAQREAERD